MVGRSVFKYLSPLEADLMRPLLSILFAALAPLACASCTSSSVPAARPTPTSPPPARVSTDIKRLGRLVNLPRRPLKVAWTYEPRSREVTDPKDREILAVMLFTPRDIASFKPSPIQPLHPNSEFWPLSEWFPHDLKQKAIDYQGQRALPTRRLSSKEFFKTSMRNGVLLRVPGTNYCLLSLYTMLAYEKS